MAYEHDESSEHSDKVVFTPPSGFQPPEGSESGTFDLVCTFRSEAGGKLCLVKLGDMEMPEYKGDGGKDTKPDYSEYAKGIQSGMAESMGGGGQSQGSY